MSIVQILRIVWARKWVSMLLFVVIAGAGLAVVSQLPPRYYAQTSLLVEVRPDPLLGNLAVPFNMGSQLELLHSDVVALRAVEYLRLVEDPDLTATWQAAAPNMPQDLFWARILLTGLQAESSRGGNLIRIGYLHEDPAFAARAANAFAQAAIDTSIAMRVDPARESANWVDDQVRTTRHNLEQAQTKLTQFQRDKDIVITDDRLTQEATRLTVLQTQLAAAEAEWMDALSRQRASGSDGSPDAAQNEQVRAVRAQVSAAQARVAELSSVMGVNHPQRQQAEAQLAQLRQQLAAEVARVSSTASALSRASSQKVQELRGMVDAQNRRLLSMRSDYDRIDVLRREVEAAQRAFDSIAQRGSQANLQSQLAQSVLKQMSPAIEPSQPSKKRALIGIAAVLAAAFAAGVGLPFGLELLDRRVRGIEDLLGEHGVPVIGVLRPAGSRRPTYRKLARTRQPERPQLPDAGAGAGVGALR